jgi:lincosamide and streptogramin A transport system ATP-binding/permease protein
MFQGTLSDLCREKGADETKVKSLLHYLGFEKDQLRAMTQSLSRGQWRKVMLALSLSCESHLYLWDEPLDFQDFFSRAQIEDLVLESKPSLIFIEHDQTFVESVATEILDLTHYSLSIK